MNGIMDTIRDRLRDPIKAAGQTKVAEAAGVAQPNLSAWLAGKRQMTPENCERIAETLGLRISVRFTKNGHRKKTKPAG